jgi:hypothetical protein
MRHCISQPHDAQALIFPVKLYPRHCLPQSHYVSHFRPFGVELRCFIAGVGPLLCPIYSNF